jgi:hypothetical protein
LPPGVASIWQRAWERRSRLLWHAGSIRCLPSGPPLAVLVVTGTWNIAAEQDRTNLIAKLAMVLVPGVTAFLHAPS